MIKSTIQYTIIGLATLALVTAPLTAAEKANKTDKADKADKAEKAKKEPKEAKGIPFHGRLMSKTDTSITLHERTERTIEITSDTKITKAGKPGTLADATVGEEVAGMYVAGEKNVAKSLRIGAKPEEKKAEKKTEKPATKPDAKQPAATPATPATPAAPAAPAVPAAK
ncbi:MAG: hypothetical protein RLY20_3010 [Verrucomicrobiota bacterium]|jgi:hypothetical protein